MGDLPRAFRYLLPYWKLAVASGVLTVLSALVALLVPWPLKLVVDSVLQDQPPPGVVVGVLGDLVSSRTSLLVVGVVSSALVTFVHNALGVAEKYVNTTLKQGMVLDLRSDLFQHAQRLSLTFHDHRNTGDFLARIHDQATAVGTVPLTVPRLAKSVLTLIGMFWVAFHIDAELALLSLTVVPLLYYTTTHYTRSIKPRAHEVRELEGESLGIIQEALSMLRVIIAFGREDYEHDRFRSHGEDAVDARIRLTLRQTLFSLAVNATTAIGTALVLGLGALHALQGQLTIGQLLVVLSYIASVYSPLQTISSTAGTLQEKVVSLRRAFELLETEPEVREAPNARRLPTLASHLVFDDVRFNYRDRVDTLKDISFDVAPGGLIGIVGPTGAGKTTLLSLVPRFYDPSGGRILLDGHDLRGLTVRSLREQISMVLQEPRLFSGTIADNIRYGRFSASMGEIVEAAENANAHDFIMRLPDGYDTRVGEAGVQLSGGERQRICITRAFLKDAPILLLDEPTSAVDTRTEALILDALERLMARRTTLLITHRLPTVQRADRILVLERGRLIEHGTHDQLLRQDGLYRRLHGSQRARPRGEGQLRLRTSEGGTGLRRAA